MTDHDPLDALLREWKPPEPRMELDENVVRAYRATLSEGRRLPAWRRFWDSRVSIPAPLLVAAMAAVVILLFWLRPAAVPARPSDTPGVVTRLNATGFEPLPNGEARIVSVKETHP
jgi:hypothetical protein